MKMSPKDWWLRVIRCTFEETLDHEEKKSDLSRSLPSLVFILTDSS
jgi:hypothetical protein